MTVRPGEQWGSPCEVPADAPVADSDAELGRLLAGGAAGPVVVGGGDLHRTLGAPARTGGAGADTGLPIDVLRVVADGRALTAVAHVVVRGRGPTGWWRGPLVAVMNAQFLGPWDVAPRAHPNDGRLDTVAVDATMSWRERWQAWRRLPSGTHVPHPRVAVRRGTEEFLTFDRPLGLWVDGVAAGTVRRLVVRVDPDAATVLV